MELGQCPRQGLSCHTQHSLSLLTLWGFGTHYLRASIPSGFNSVENYVQEQLVSTLCSTNSHLPPHPVEEGPGWVRLGIEGADRIDNTPLLCASDPIRYPVALGPVTRHAGSGDA